MMTGRVLLLSCSTGGPAIAATSATCDHADRLGTGRGSRPAWFRRVEQAADLPRQLRRRRAGAKPPRTHRRARAGRGRARRVRRRQRGGARAGEDPARDRARHGARPTTAGNRVALTLRGKPAGVLVPVPAPHRAGRAADRRSPEQVRSYLRHIWSRWSGPDFVVTDTDLDDLVDRYGSPGHFCASIAWYRPGPDAYDLSAPTAHPGPRSTVPLTLLWPQLDPLSPPSGPRRSTSTTPMPTSVPSTASVTSSPANNHT